MWTADAPPVFVPANWGDKWETRLGCRPTALPPDSLPTLPLHFALPCGKPVATMGKKKAGQPAKAIPPNP